jgi:hypothetical protein
LGRDNIEFDVAQVIDNLLRSWFSIDPTFIVSNLEEEDEGVARLSPKVQTTRSSKILRTHFQHAPIDLDKEMEDIEEINGMKT